MTGPCITPGCTTPTAADSLLCPDHRATLDGDVHHLTSPDGLRETWAIELRGLYLSLTGQGFTEDQALRILGETIRSMFAANG